MKPSRSLDRHSFQRKGYVKRQTEKGEPINEAYLDLFDMLSEQERTKWDDPKSRENNLEWDLLTTDWILEKVRASDVYAQNLYAALCNVKWQNKKLWPTLKEETWGCSWRYAGGIIADMQEKGDYIDWYCSGSGFFIGDGIDPPEGYVAESMITKEIEADLDRLGWIPIPNIED